MAGEDQLSNIQMDGNDLYYEEMFTDRQVGSVQRLTPVAKDGSPDKSRSVRFVGQTQLMTPAGALPLHFDIEAQSLDDAIDKFGEAAQQAAEDTLERLREAQREAGSSLYVPGQGGGGAGMPGGGMPGGAGGGVQMP